VRSRYHCCSGNAIIVAYSECLFVALVTQHARRMCHIISSYVGYSAPPYFSTLSHKRHDFRKNFTENRHCVLIFSSSLSEIFFVLRMIERNIIININRTSCKVPIILVRF
jgi:hypothetical protein